MPDQLKQMTPEEIETIKLAMKQAIQEWLDKKFAQFGKWSAAGIGAAALSVLAYFLSQGMHK